MRRFILATLAALGLVLAAAQPANAGRTASVIYTLDAAGFTQAGAAARTLSSGSGVAVVVGSCVAGSPGCIKASLVDVACGNGGALGCAYGSFASGCTVEVSRVTYSWKDDAVMEHNVLGHEGGHCIMGTGWHNPNPRSLMNAALSPHDNKKSLDKADKQRAQAVNSLT